MTYEWLDGDDVKQLDGIFSENGWPLLNPLLARALVARDDAGEIVGCFVLQLVSHAEPLFVKPELRGQGIAEELADRMQAFLAEMKAHSVFVIPGSQFAEQLCFNHGLKKLDKPVYVYWGQPNGGVH